MYQRRSAVKRATAETATATETLVASMPAEIVEKIQTNNIEYELNKKEFTIKRDTYKLRMFQQDLATKTTQAGFTVMTINCNKTMGDLRRVVLHHLNTSSTTETKTDDKVLLTMEHIRLREYDTIRNLVTRVYEESEDKQTLKSCKLTKTNPFMVEISLTGFAENWNPETTLSLCMKK
jgi:hypothetical protein